MRFPKTFVKYLLYPINEFFMGNNTMRYAHQLMRSQHSDANTLATLQHQKFHEMLHYVSSNVPYYSERFEKLHSPTTVEQLPILTVSDIKRYKHKLLAKGYEASYKIKTTIGPAGEPLDMYVNEDYFAWHEAARIRARSWWGIGLGETVLNLITYPFAVKQFSTFRQWDNRLFNIINVWFKHLTPRQVAKYHALLLNYKPSVILSIPSTLFIMCEAFKRHGLKLNHYKPKLIVFRSESISQTQMDTIRSYFNCDVTTEYLINGVGMIAHGCPKGRLHVNAEHVFPEYTDKMIITNLDSKMFPLIRYQLDDHVKPLHDACSCGVTLPTIELLSGRRGVIINNADNVQIPAILLAKTLGALPGIKRFQIVVKSSSHIHIRIVEMHSFHYNNLGVIVSEIKNWMGSQMTVDFSFIPEEAERELGRESWLKVENEEK